MCEPKSCFENKDIEKFITGCKCDYIPNKVIIEYPYDLKRIIGAIREALELGILKEIIGIELRNNLFNEVSDKGPWEDILDFEFCCTACDRKFKLFSDTYHGRGEWTSL